MSAQYAMCQTVCPVCWTPLRFEHRSDAVEGEPSLWGLIPITDTGCMEVTRPWSPDVEDHLSAHRKDGTFMAALAKHHAHAAASAAAFFTRWDEAGAPLKEQTP